jgi:hypothetical protein
MDNNQQGGRFITWAFAAVAPFFFVLALLVRPDMIFVALMIYIGLMTSFFATVLMPFEVRRAEKTSQKVASWSLLLFNGAFYLFFAIWLINGLFLSKL